jgi:hypothetical protein
VTFDKWFRETHGDAFNSSMMHVGAQSAWHHQQTRIDALEAGLKLLAEGSTPWQDTDTTDREPWQVMATYAQNLLDGKQ